MKSRFKSKSKLVKGPGGRWLCRCGCERECLPPRRTFFSQECVHDYLLRTSNSYLRRCVKERDKGVCCKCGLDCGRLRRQFRKAIKEKNKELIAELKQKYPRLRSDRSYWEADHILAVVKGGGQCGLDNLRTLCMECHLEVTRELRIELKNNKRTVDGGK